jgi:hypothetical protein
MQDLLYIGITGAFFACSFGFLEFLDRLAR